MVEINTTKSLRLVKNYQTLVRLYHADKWNSSKKFIELEGSEKFKRTFNAYQNLLMPNTLF